MMTVARLRSPDWGREIAYGLLGWLLFLAALEPGIVARATADGEALQWDRELMRVLGAASMGALTTPFVMALIRHYPVEADDFWKRVVIHGVASCAIALLLIAVSCLLAPVLQVGDTRPFRQAFPDHVAANWLLLTYCLVAMTGMAHAVRYFSEARQTRRVEAELHAQPKAATGPEPVSFLQQVTIRERGLIRVVDLDSVDWIEAQGNYLALHVGASTHMLRETLTALESRLDPSKFRRIHRRMIVAVERIREVNSVSNGDGVARLHGGAELKVSRSYRANLVSRLLKP